jgi:hypothetical protein
MGFFELYTSDSHALVERYELTPARGAGDTQMYSVSRQVMLRHSPTVSFDALLTLQLGYMQPVAAQR